MSAEEEIGKVEFDLLFEEPRGCGLRSAGADGVGIYLRGEIQESSCGRLPFPMGACPCCGEGIKPARGFTWINPQVLFDNDREPSCKHSVHVQCPRDCALDMTTGAMSDQEGLIWIGVSHYKTPYEFVREARRRGVSRKLSALPNGFVVGKNFVFLGHKLGTIIAVDGKPVYAPAVFGWFKPTHVELVVDDPENLPEKALNLKRKLGGRGRIVKVIHEREAA